MRHIYLVLIPLIFISKITFAQISSPLGSVGINMSAPKISYRGAAAILYLNGKVYWGTGENPSNYYNDWWQIDPVTKVFTQMASLPGDPRSGTIAFTIANKCYVGTGEKYLKRYKDFFEYDPATNSWTEKSKVPEEKRSYAVGFAIGDYGYVTTGDAENFGELKDLRQYNPVTDKWIDKAPLPGLERRYAAGFALNGLGYVGTGYTSGPLLKDFWSYNPDNDTWTQKADFGGGGVELSTGFSLNDRGYILASETNELWQYNPADNTWKKEESYPGEALDARAAVTWGDTALLTGISHYLGVNCNEFFIYDDNTNKWSPFFKDGSGFAYRAGAIGFGINNKCYVGTGYPTATTGSFTDLFELDLSTNNWSQMIDLPQSGRSGAVAFTIGGKGYVGTGDKQFSDASFKDLWEFDPATGSWTQKADFGGTARGFATGFATSTKGYIGLGTDAGVLKSDFWQYDPISNTWSPVADYPGGSRQSAVSFRIGNNGYVGTGVNASGNTMKDFYCYNSDSNTWKQVADFGGVARKNAIAFGSQSKGYAGLGISAAGKVKRDLWAYDPSLNVWNAIPDFAGVSRQSAVGFEMNGKGYIGTGIDSAGKYLADFWELNLCQSEYILISASKPTSFCDGGSVKLTITGAGAATYQWMKNGVIIEDETSIEYKAKKSGNYTCSVTNACGNFISNTVTVTEFPLPQAKIKGDSFVEICEGDEIKMKAKENEGYTYQWLMNDITIPGATNRYYYASQAGDYRVIVVDANSCTKTSKAVELIISCRQGQHKVNSGLSVYPNPAFDKLYFTYDGKSPALRVMVFNIIGVKVLETTVNNPSKLISVDIHSVKDGMYFLQVLDNEESISIPFEVKH